MFTSGIALASLTGLAAWGAFEASGEIKVRMMFEVLFRGVV